MRELLQRGRELVAAWEEEKLPVELFKLTPAFKAFKGALEKFSQVDTATDWYTKYAEKNEEVQRWREACKKFGHAALQYDEPYPYWLIDAFKMLKIGDLEGIELIAEGRWQPGGR
jgi:hypothetical protein